MTSCLLPVMSSQQGCRVCPVMHPPDEEHKVPHDLASCSVPNRHQAGLRECSARQPCQSGCRLTHWLRDKVAGNDERYEEQRHDHAEDAPVPPDDQEQQRRDAACRYLGGLRGA